MIEKVGNDSLSHENMEEIKAIVHTSRGLPISKIPKSSSFCCRQFRLFQSSIKSLYHYLGGPGNLLPIVYNVHCDFK